MALARTDHGAWSKVNNYSDADVVSGAFTPPNNSLLVAIASVVDPENATWADDIACSGGSLTWTRRVNQTSNAAGIVIFTAPVTTGASMTITANRVGGAVGATYLRAMSYTDYDVASPIGATQGHEELVSSSFLTSLSDTLSAAPASNSVVLAAFTMTDTGAAIAPGGGGGFTEIFQDELQAGWLSTQFQTRTSSTSTTVDWTFGSKQADRLAAAGIEIKQAAAGGGSGARFSSQVIG